MSYILDALRRSQAERERGRVPGIDAQPAEPEPPPLARTLRGVPMAWAASAVGLMLFAVAAVVAWWWSRQQPPPVAAEVRAAARVASAPRPPVTPVAAVAPPEGDAAPQAPRPPLPQVVSVAPAAMPPPPAPVARPQPAPPAAPGRALTLAELSADQRRELPPLAVGGSVWSDSAVVRFVVINGQVVREGEAAAPGVTVERIGAKAVLLRWRELRIELAL